MVCFGPLTNLASALLLDATLAQRLGGAVLLGGDWLVLSVLTLFCCFEGLFDLATFTDCIISILWWHKLKVG